MKLRLPKCEFCKLFNEQDYVCPAFPDGIPPMNLWNDEAEECAHGIKFIEKCKRPERIIPILQAEIQAFLDGNREPLLFSVTFPELIYYNYDRLLDENPTLAKQVEETFPAICAEYEIGENPAGFKAQISLAYNRLFSPAVISPLLNKLRII